MNKKDVKYKALETLKEYYNDGKEISLPVPIKAIAKSYNIRVIPYSRHMKTLNMTLDELYNHAGTKDAYTDFDACSESYIIIYNDMDYYIKTSNRYRWNIAHELGHILLGHHKKIQTKIGSNQLTQDEYAILEKEANWFASYILVPHSVLYSLNKFMNADSIKSYCRISNEAAKCREEDFKKWKENNKFFNNYDKELLKIFSHQHICENCKTLVDNKHLYCSVCGEKSDFNTYYKNSIKKKVEFMKYKNFLNDDGTLTVCPVCQNEEILKNAKYCHICGSSVVNGCLNDNYEPCEQARLNPIPSNARYCPYCGSNTVFKAILPNWKEEQQTKTLSEEVEIIKSLKDGPEDF